MNYKKIRNQRKKVGFFSCKLKLSCIFVKEITIKTIKNERIYRGNNNNN